MTFHQDTIELLRNALNSRHDQLAEANRKVDFRRQKLADDQEELGRAEEKAATLAANIADCQRWLDYAEQCNRAEESGGLNARIHALQGRLMAELADCDLDAWSIQCRELSAMLHKNHGGSREGIAIIAERLGIEYAEKPRGVQIYVEAGGKIDGIQVKIWSLLDADQVPADNGRELDDVYAEGERQAEGARLAEENEAEWQATRDAEAADDAMSASERFGHDQADEAQLDAAAAVWSDVMFGDAESGS